MVGISKAGIHPTITVLSILFGRAVHALVSFQHQAGQRLCAAAADIRHIVAVTIVSNAPQWRYLWKHHAIDGAASCSGISH